MSIEDEDDICICNTRGHGRLLVQCDSCQRWYHLQCIGIRTIAELGRAEDAWFCRSCMTNAFGPPRANTPTHLQFGELQTQRSTNLSIIHSYLIQLMMLYNTPGLFDYDRGGSSLGHFQRRNRERGSEWTRSLSCLPLLTRPLRFWETWWCIYLSGSA